MYFKNKFVQLYRWGWCVCLWSRVLKPSSLKEVNSAGESCGSRPCGCGSAASSACSSGQQPHGAACDTEPGLALGGRAEHPHQHCPEPLQLCLCPALCRGPCTPVCGANTWSKHTRITPVSLKGH